MQVAGQRRPGRGELGARAAASAARACAAARSAPQQRVLLDREEVQLRAALRVVAPGLPGGEEIVAEAEAGLEDRRSVRGRASAAAARCRRGRHGAPARMRRGAGDRRRRTRRTRGAVASSRSSRAGTIGAVVHAVAGCASRDAQRLEQAIARRSQAAVGEHRGRHAGERVVQPGGLRRRGAAPAPSGCAVDVDREHRLPHARHRNEGLVLGARRLATAASASASRRSGQRRRRVADAACRRGSARDRPDEALPALAAGDQAGQTCRCAAISSGCRRPAHAPRRSGGRPCPRAPSATAGRPRARESSRWRRR